jgi:hypothetical protein
VDRLPVGRTVNAYDTEEDKAGQAAYSAAAFAKGAISSHFKPLFVTLI